MTSKHDFVSCGRPLCNFCHHKGPLGVCGRSKESHKRKQGQGAAE